MARSPRLVCVLAGRRVRPGSRRPRVERGVWSEVREGVGWGRSGSVWDRLRFPLPLPLPLPSPLPRPALTSPPYRGGGCSRASCLFPVRLFRVYEGRYVVTGF